MRDDGSWGDSRERDERSFRQGDVRTRSGYEQPRYDDERSHWRGDRPRYGASDWDRDREWGWSQYGEEDRARYAAQHPRFGQDYGARNFRPDFAPSENRWDERYNRTTLRGIGSSGGEPHGRAFDGWHSHQTNQGGFSGKGPRDYTRSDERIREDVCDRLSLDDWLDASDITVSVSKGEVTLEGTVPDRHAKRRAEDIADWVLGVNEVHNRLRSNKGLMQEVGDKIMGRETESTGHAGSGTRNAPAGTSHTTQNSH